MQLVVFGDVHIYKINEYSRPTVDGMTTLLNECRDSLDWVASYIEEHHAEIDMVVNLGDLFHDKKIVDGLSMHVGWFGMLRIHQICSKYDIDLISLVGNHEWITEGKTCTVHFLDYLGELITQPKILAGALFLPYTKDTKNVLKYVDEYLEYTETSDKPPIIFSHVDVVGGSWGGKLSDMGVTVDAIGDAVMFNGHFHTPQIIEGSRGSIINVGSLMYKNFKDQFEPMGEPRGILHIEWGTEISFQRIENTNTSIFYSISADDEDDLLDKVMMVLPNKRMNMRVIPTGFTVPEGTVPLEGFRNVKILPPSTPQTDRKSFSGEAEPIALWENYLAAIEISSSIDVERCKELGKKILARAMSMSPESSYENIKILEWGAENFLSIQKVRLVVPEDEAVVVVTGVNMDSTSADNNGAGKSALFEIIPFTFWGRTVRDLKIDETIHTQNVKGGCSSYVVFMKGDTVYKITRSRGKSNSLSITADGEDISENIEVQRQVNGLLRFTFDEFKQLVYLGGRSNHFTDIKDDTKRKDLLETVIGTKLYSIAEDVAVADRTELYNSVETIENYIKEREDSIGRFRIQIDDLLHLKEVTEQQAKMRVEKLRERITETEKELEEAKSKRFTLEDFLAKMDRSLDKWRKSREESAVAYDDMRYEITRVQERISQITEEKVTKKALLEKGICDKCGSRLPKKKFQDDVLFIEDRIDKEKDKLHKMETEEGKLKLAMETAKSQYENIMQKRVDKTTEINSLKFEIKRLSGDIDKWKDEIEGAEEEANLLNPKIEQAKEDLERVTQEKKILREKLLSKVGDLEIANFVAEQFHATKLRSYVLSYAIDLGNDYIRHIASVFSNGETFVQISPEREQKKKTVSKIDFIASTKAASFNGSSSGEKDRMNLELQLALSELSRKYRNEFNVLIIDEEASGLDDTGMDYMIKMLGELGKVVFLVSQQSKMKTASEKRIIATKENDFTTYEFENFGG